MTISEYACDGCGYTDQGCGGLGLMMSGAARQTLLRHVPGAPRCGRPREPLGADGPAA